MSETDVVVVGAGLAGLVASAELAAAGRRVILLDQEPEQSLGGQAFWSLGGLFLIDSPEQRRLGIRDSYEIAMKDWLRSAGFDRPEDSWPARWAEAYVRFAAGEKRSWLRGLGVGFFPIIGWAERALAEPPGPGNSVPRFHVAWGTGPGLVAPFERLVREAVDHGLVQLKFRHRVDSLSTCAGAVSGVAGHVLAPDSAGRGHASSRTEIDEFSIDAGAVILATGGIGGDTALIRKMWPARLGPMPDDILTGVPAHVDGRILAIAETAGGVVSNRDRMWHYTEGIRNWNPIWPNHGIRILPGPSSLWLDAFGNRLPAELIPGSDTLAALDYITHTDQDHSWFVLNQAIIKREFALSGSEQNPDLTGRNIRLLFSRLASRRAPGPIESFKARGIDFAVAGTVMELADAMNGITGRGLIDAAAVKRAIETRDGSTEDPQMAAIHKARRFAGERLLRVAKPRPLLEPDSGPLIAVRLRLLTRKTLGGLQTDLSARVLDSAGVPIPGVFAAGEVTGFGGGGMHGYRALEGTFLGGCLFSGRIAGRSAAESVR